MMAFKQDGVDGNVKGVEFLFKKNKIDLQGTGRILAAGKVEVKAPMATRCLRPRTSSSPPAPMSRLRGIEIDEKRIVSSTGALALGKVPEQAAGDRRGRDRARAGLGVAPPRREVTVVEFLDRILPGMDGEVARQFQRILQKQGMDSSSAPRSRASIRRARS
jgi:dihydrolipoamide dehydrogenase